MYSDGQWPTIGDADLQWKSHGGSFNVSGNVIDNGVEKTVSNIAEFIDNKIGGRAAERSVSFMNSLQIGIEVEIVDKVGKELQDRYWDDLMTQVGVLDLSTQQLYALMEIKYAFGSLPIRNGKSFSQVYLDGLNQDGVTKNSWKHNQYIWDNWWAYVGGGWDIHIPARDVGYETYVKGLMNINESEAGTITNRQYYIYYTEEQLNYYKNMIGTAHYTSDLIKPITRDTNNETHEKEIFTYVENNSIGTGSGDVQAFLDASAEISEQYITDGWHYYRELGELYWNNIEKSLNNPHKATCCATYVGCALYAAGMFSEEEMNASDVNYNSPWGLATFLKSKGWKEKHSYNELEPGDVVIIGCENKEGIYDPYGHVQTYAGDDYWYNGGSVGVGTSQPGLDTTWAPNNITVAYGLK